MYCIEKLFNKEDKEIKRIILKNKNNMEVKLLNYGATIEELLVPDRKGMIENIVLTYENVEDYLVNPSYFGVTVGRTAGRIGEGRFVLDGRIYELDKNYGPNQGHGGRDGFSFQVWEETIVEKEESIGVVFSYTSKHMEGGYPGNIEVKTIYTLTNENQLWIEYKAKTDEKTLCNLTNHSYFNLSGNYRTKVTEQYLKIKAQHFLELSETQVPTGNIIPVVSTPMDFTQWKRIGRDIESSYSQLRMTEGYDHTWILREREKQIQMIDKKSGRMMTISTTYPSVVIYSYNFPDNKKLKYGKTGSKHDGICFETQYEPDGIHHDHLHQGILEVGQEYDEKIVFTFEVI